MKRLFGIAALLAALVACSDPAPSGDAEPQLESDPVVLPEQFAVRRCTHVDAGRGCLIVQAGGKVLVFGAPEGAADSLDGIDAPVPDAVFVATLSPDELEGLARIRNQSWLAGRTTLLPVIGPEGIAVFTAGIDDAFARSDAKVYLEHRPPGTFDTALMAARKIPPASRGGAFDTGDLRVDALASPGSGITFVVRYDGAALQISTCGEDAVAPQGIVVTLSLSCEAQRDPAAWPGAGNVVFVGN
ncbi:MAG: hypothetical protein AAFY10_08230 [Pseudomonadota bacterium]